MYEAHEALIAAAQDVQNFATIFGGAFVVAQLIVFGLKILVKVAKVNKGNIVIPSLAVSICRNHKELSLNLVNSLCAATDFRGSLLMNLLEAREECLCLLKRIEVFMLSSMAWKMWSWTEVFDIINTAASLHVKVKLANLTAAVLQLPSEQFPLQGVVTLATRYSELQER